MARIYAFQNNPIKLVHVKQNHWYLNYTTIDPHFSIEPRSSKLRL